MLRRTITIEEALQKDVDLVSLIGDFQETSSLHARNMIDEYHINGNLDKSNKSPYSVNQNMCCVKDGIVLQFSCKYNEANADEVQISHSKTSRELRAIDTVTKAAAENYSENDMVFLSILMAIIDYKGFRVVAHADMSHLKVNYFVKY